MTQLYAEDLLNPVQKCDKVSTEIHSDFIEVRSRRGKLVFRFDPVRMLVDWRDGQDGELIDLLPYIR